MDHQPGTCMFVLSWCYQFVTIKLQVVSILYQKLKFTFHSVFRRLLASKTNPCILFQVDLLRHFRPKEEWNHHENGKKKTNNKSFVEKIQTSMFWGQFCLSQKLNFFIMYCTIFTPKYAYNQINPSWFWEQERYCTTLPSKFSILFCHGQCHQPHYRQGQLWLRLSSITFLVQPSISRAWKISLWPLLASCFQLRTV